MIRGLGENSCTCTIEGPLGHHYEPRTTLTIHQRIESLFINAAAWGASSSETSMVNCGDAPDRNFAHIDWGPSISVSAPTRASQKFDQQLPKLSRFCQKKRFVLFEFRGLEFQAVLVNGVRSRDAIGAHFAPAIHLSE